jgi:5'-deoxynucleotidase YfbR-like HD superfamily hydrolase
MTDGDDKRITKNQLTSEILKLYGDLLLPFMKVRRDMPFPSENGRQETDSEHVFTLGMVAITIADRLKLGLDTGLIAKYALVHDLVEAYAGDVSARSEDEYDLKHHKEHEAYLKIKENYAESAPWIAQLIEQYENKQDEESRFVYAIDKTMGALVRIIDNGETWEDYYPQVDGSGFHKVKEKLRKKAKSHPEALEFFDAIYGELDSRWPAYIKRRDR